MRLAGVAWPVAVTPFPVTGGDSAAVAAVRGSARVMTVRVVQQAEHGEGEDEHRHHAAPEAAPGVMVLAVAAAV
jgi:hypothetical protein